MEQQTQAFCHRCERESLFTRNPNTPNHALHFLLSLICCLWWVPVWLLLTILRKPSPWRCSQCGQLVGEITAEQVQAMQVAADEEAEYRRDVRRGRAIDRAQKRAVLWDRLTVWAGVARDRLTDVANRFAEWFLRKHHELAEDMPAVHYFIVGLLVAALVGSTVVIVWIIASLF